MLRHNVPFRHFKDQEPPLVQSAKKVAEARQYKYDSICHLSLVQHTNYQTRKLFFLQKIFYLIVYFF